MNPFSVLGAKIFAGVSGVLLIALTAALVWGRAGWNSAAKWREVAGIEKNARETLEGAYRAASETARATAEARKRETEERDERNRENHDNAYREALADARRRGDAYARAHRVSGAPAADTGAAGGADLPSPAFGAEVDHGPRGPAELVAITRTDFDICTVNSLRIADAHAWDADGVDRSLP